jgi:hypothetical protein
MYLWLIVMLGGSDSYQPKTTLEIIKKSNATKYQPVKHKSVWTFPCGHSNKKSSGCEKLPQTTSSCSMRGIHQLVYFPFSWMFAVRQNCKVF